MTIQGSIIRDIASSKELIFITGTEQSDITIAATSISNVSFTSTILESSATFSGNTITFMKGTLITAEVSNASIHSCKFTDLKNDGGYFIQGHGAIAITVVDSIFENFPENSLVYLSETQSFTSINSSYRAKVSQEYTLGKTNIRAIEAFETTTTLEQNIFEHSESAKGGALKLTNSNATLKGNTFKNNYAEKGGAIAFLCQVDTICSANMEENVFQGNQAIEGGAIHYNMFKPFLGTSNSFVNNKADYGPNLSSYAAYLELPSND